MLLILLFIEKLRKPSVLALVFIFIGLVKYSARFIILILCHKRLIAAMWKNVKFKGNNKFSCLYNIENVNVFLRWENCRQPSAGIRTGSCGFCPILGLCYQREANPLSIWFSDKGCSANCQRNFYYLVAWLLISVWKF